MRRSNGHSIGDGEFGNCWKLVARLELARPDLLAQGLSDDLVRPARRGRRGDTRFSACAALSANRHDRIKLAGVARVRAHRGWTPVPGARVRVSQTPECSSNCGNYRGWNAHWDYEVVAGIG